MGNLSNRLERLFRDYLIRKENEKKVPVTYGSTTRTSWLNNNNTLYNGVILFYEWSDLFNAPTLFYNIGAFKEFLVRSNIPLAPYQENIIRQLDRSYISCKEGTHDLLIRGTRELLTAAMKNKESAGVDRDTTTKAVANSPIPPSNALPVPISPLGSFCQAERKSPMYSGYPEEWY